MINIFRRKKAEDKIKKALSCILNAKELGAKDIKVFQEEQYSIFDNNIRHRLSIVWYENGEKKRCDSHFRFALMTEETAKKYGHLVDVPILVRKRK